MGRCRDRRTTAHIHATQQEIDGVLATTTTITADGSTRSLPSPALFVAHGAAATTISSAPGRLPSTAALVTAAVGTAALAADAFRAGPSRWCNAISFPWLSIHGRLQRDGGRGHPRSVHSPLRAARMYRERNSTGEGVVRSQWETTARCGGYCHKHPHAVSWDRPSPPPPSKDLAALSLGTATHLASPPLSHVKNRTSASTQSPPGRHGGDQGAARRGVGDDAHDLQGRACAPTPSPSRHTRGRATPPSPARCRRRTRSRHTECQQQGERRTNGVWVSLPRCGASRRPAGVQQGSGRQTTRAGPRRNTVVPATTRRRSD